MNAPFLRPGGCPVGVNPADWRLAVSQRIEQLASAMTVLIEVLDQMDDDPDLEPSEDFEPSVGWSGNGPGNCGYDDGGREADDCDDEPTFGSPEQLPSRSDQTYWAAGYADGSESEEENEGGGDVLDVPHICGAIE